MTKKELFFRFAKEVALLRFEIGFEEDSIQEGEKYQDEVRIEYCEDRIRSKTGQIEGILRLARTFKLDAENLNLLSFNLVASFNYEDVKDMIQNPFLKEVRR